MFIRPSTVLVMLVGLTALVSAGAPVPRGTHGLEDLENEPPVPRRTHRRKDLETIPPVPRGTHRLEDRENEPPREVVVKIFCSFSIAYAAKRPFMTICSLTPRHQRLGTVLHKRIQ
ncbi:hypothetical protein BDR03DRAFT_997929 [Suillus americanus]|nr:hypothetical protein BDR03DRAFT_997929 [Suillus americanus]